MPRRTEPAELVAARDLLRANHDAQQDAVGAFFDTSARLAALRSEVDAMETQQQVHAGALAELLGIDTAARVTGWPKARLGEALRTRRSRRERSPSTSPPRGSDVGGAQAAAEGSTLQTVGA